MHDLIKLNKTTISNLVTASNPNIIDAVFNEDFAVIYFDTNKSRNDFVNEILHIGIHCEVGIGELNLKITF